MAVAMDVLGHETYSYNNGHVRFPAAYLKWYEIF